MSDYAPPPTGLPEHLPAGERLLWQGRPDWRAFARSAFHVRGLNLYLTAVVAWCAVSLVMDQGWTQQTALSVTRYAAIAAAPVLFLLAYAWLIARSTTYTITSKRVVMRQGSVVPMTINIPYTRIESAALSTKVDGFGDISLLLSGKDRLAYFMLWPHARPWRVAKSEPSLRAVPDVVKVGQILARALAASADLPAPAFAAGAEPLATVQTVPA